MDRPIIYSGEALRAPDLLNAARGAMIGLAKLSEAVFGSATLVDGLACAPATGLNISIGPGSIYSAAQIDPTAYGPLPADTRSILKQGLLMDATSMACPAPTTSGRSINYLVQVQFQEVDAENVALPFYNSANPSVPLFQNGNTLRKDICAVAIKAGAQATTGSQVTPAPDAGWTGVWVVTVAFGAASVLAGNISAYPGAPFIARRQRDLAMLLTGQVATGTANAIVVTPNPPLAAYVTGLRMSVIPPVTNTGATTINISGLGARAIVNPDGSALAAGEIVAGRPIDLHQLSSGQFVLMSAPWAATRPPGDASTFPASTAYADTAANNAAAVAGANNIFVWQQQGF